MNNVEYSTKSLIRAIRTSNEYNHYHRVLEKIKHDEYLYVGMNEYRKRCFLLQMGNDDTYLDDLDKLRYEFKEILNNSLVSEFLIAEQRLNKMTRQINASILDCVNLDVNFL
ncbi:MAG: YlbF family regulator [Lachnospiraceae bacterium]|jgi:cell fate (sporulation/competence/biofilm development) regulator YlbF (YheA/YmcA/DUF963 family)|nr:YlbF family regulator [Lachnospiraceae bacterium]